SLPCFYTLSLHDALPICPHSVHEINMYDNQTRSGYPRYPGEIKNMKDLKDMIDGYDCGIRYADNQIGKLFENLEEKEVMDDLVRSEEHTSELQSRFDLVC